MDLVNVRDLYRNEEVYANTEVTIGGWLRSKRDSKSFGFLVINDGTFFEPVQVVYADQLPNFAEISKLNVGVQFSYSAPYSRVCELGTALCLRNKGLWVQIPPRLPLLLDGRVP